MSEKNAFCFEMQIYLQLLRFFANVSSFFITKVTKCHENVPFLDWCTVHHYLAAFYQACCTCADGSSIAFDRIYTCAQYLC